MQTAATMKRITLDKEEIKSVAQKAIDEIRDNPKPCQDDLDTINALMEVNDTKKFIEAALYTAAQMDDMRILLGLINFGMRLQRAIDDKQMDKMMREVN